MTTTTKIPALPVLAVLTILAAPAAGTHTVRAQVSVRSAEGCPDPDRGSLGITGFRCDHCSFSRNRSGFTSAEFLTEPEVFAVADDATGGDDLRVGDVLVAVDGELITTDAGARRFTSLPAGEWVQVTVRRDGRTRELRVRTARACEVTVSPPNAPLPPPESPEAEAPPVPLDPPVPDRAPPDEPDEPRALPPLPAPSIAPGASLGFGLECGHCTYHSGSEGEGRAATWSFEEAPRLYQVRQGGPAWTAGLRGGDVLEEIDGIPLTSAEGGRRFARVRPGREVVWTVRRGSRRLHVTTVPEARSRRAEPEAGDGPLRYTGSVGDADVEVRGGAVTVREDPEEGVVVIRTGDVVVRIRHRSGGADR